ncbi:Similar to Levodione reductase; acc. no. Q9LBG2 [Pyronema omphalodes CBS 100304]|uniref:Similar to Levodione reductase acc. no. Q9LBG2 n=1 Tax=Pyronema omphalodes (strain CBS 100304) TaxID=1076935 RepID=U4LKU9_PYROM|nr:Similar to Levodione reductase; acc. no. Q9LBG2 [Pyronema omphalodes CBS 100304]
MSGFENGVALVTGAGSGLARGVVLEFVRGGCVKIVAADIIPERLAETAKLVSEINPAARVITVPTDVTNATQVQNMVDTAVKEFGRIDYSVHCAGITGGAARTDEMATEEFDRVTGVNLRGLWLCEKAVLGQMKTQEPRKLSNGTSARGAVVNMSSVLGLVGYRVQSPYVVSKHGVLGLTKADAVDYAADGIRVNAVCPGIVRTNLLPEGAWEHMGAFIETLPMQRLGLIEEVAAAVCFLASDKASFITGTMLPVDGGYCCV